MIMFSPSTGKHSGRKVVSVFSACPVLKGRVFFPPARWPGTHSDTNSKKTTRQQRVSSIFRSDFALADLAAGWLETLKSGGAFSRRSVFAHCGSRKAMNK